MGATRRTQLLMEPEDFRQLHAEARRRGTSVAELIRLAVRDTYLTRAADRRPLVEAILSMDLPTMDWDQIRQEIEEARAHIT